MPMRQADLSGMPFRRISLRIPEALHERLVAAAEANRRSINAEILAILDQHLPRVHKEARNMQDIADVLRNAGDWAHGGDVESMAQEWASAGFTANEVKRWLDARCFEPSAARKLADADVTPEQAAQVTDDAGYRDTLGYKLSNYDITLDDVLAVVK